MKKRIFALALALCMMLSAMPTSFAGNGFLTLDNGEQAPSVPSGILTDDSKAAPQRGVLTVDGAQPIVEEVPEQPAEETPVYGVLTPDQPEEKAPVVQQPVQPAPGVLSMVCDVCGYYDGYHAADCATQQPEDESPEVEETPAQEQTEPVVTIPQEPVVTNYTVETVSTTRTARTLNVARNAAIYNSLRLAPNEGEGENSDDETDQRVDNTGVTTTKTVSGPDKEGVYTLTLETYATGSSTTTTTTETTPMDIVLVLDQSGSMTDAFTGSDSRQAAMQAAVKSFVNNVNEKYTEDADHRIAIVTFSGAGILTDGALNLLNGWVSVDDTGAGTITTAIDNLKEPTGATFVNFGMTVAQQLINNSDSSYNGKNTDREKAVVLFTDGQPERVIATGFDVDIANQAIATAKALKDQDVTVYTVGIFDGADEAVLDGASTDKKSGSVGTTWAHYFADDPNAANRFMNYTSSNFPGAENLGLERSGFAGYQFKITNNAERKAATYYQTADNAQALKDVFTTISNTVTSGGSAVELGTETVVRDVISDYFELPAGAVASKIEVSMADYIAVRDADGKITGYTWGAPVSLWPTMDEEAANDAKEVGFYTIDVDIINDKTIEVTGFDYAHYWVGSDTTTKEPHGKKLILQIPIVVESGFLGGTDVPTNGTTSGIYTEDEDGNEIIVENYPVPDVDIDVDVDKIEWNVDVNVNEQTIYLSNEAKLSALLSSSNDSILNSVNNAFVDIEFELRNAADGALLGTYTVPAGYDFDDGAWAWEAGVNSQPILTECTDYIIYCTVTDVNNKNNTDRKTTEETANVSIHVLYPTVKFQDSTIYLSQTPENPTYYNTNNLIAGGFEWAGSCVNEDHTDIPAVDENLYTDPQDDFSYEYTSDEETAFDSCTDVDVVAKVGHNDYTDYVTFVNGDSEHMGNTENTEFTVHVLKPVVNVTLTDTTAYYGDEYVLGTGANGNITLDWNDADQTAPWVNLVGEAPYGADDLSLAYAAADATDGKIIMPNSDVTVTATVMLNGEAFADSIPAFTTTCDKVTPNCPDKTKGIYTVHPLTCTLTIKNEGWDKLDVNQSFIFNVVGANAHYPVNVRVVIDEDGEAKIVGLPVGKYTVVEESDWSWRYEVTDADNDKTELTSNNSSDTITIGHNRNNPYWFDAIAETVKNIFGKGDN